MRREDHEDFEESIIDLQMQEFLLVKSLCTSGGVTSERPLLFRHD